MTSREVNPEKLSELGSQDILDQDKAIAEIIQMAVEADDGFVITADEARQFISQMDENDEFSDIELSAEALGAVAGGGSLGIHPHLCSYIGCGRRRHGMGALCEQVEGNHR